MCPPERPSGRRQLNSLPRSIPGQALASRRGLSGLPRIAFVTGISNRPEIARRPSPPDERFLVRRPLPAATAWPRASATLRREPRRDRRSPFARGDGRVHLSLIIVRSKPAVTDPPAIMTPTSVPDVPSTSIARPRARSTAEARRGHRIVEAHGPRNAESWRDMMTVAKVAGMPTRRRLPPARLIYRLPPRTRRVGRHRCPVQIAHDSPDQPGTGVPTSPRPGRCNADSRPPVKGSPHHRLPPTCDVGETANQCVGPPGSLLSSCAGCRRRNHHTARRRPARVAAPPPAVSLPRYNDPPWPRNTT